MGGGWLSTPTTKVGPFRRAKLIFAGQMFSTNGYVLLFSYVTVTRKQVALVICLLKW